MPNYDLINREERNICAHLFRLLHENLTDNMESPLAMFLNKTVIDDLRIRDSIKALHFNNLSIYSEVAIIRDAYHHNKANTKPLMDKLVRIIMKQEGVDACKLYSELPEILNTPNLTHPKQILQKAINKRISMSDGEINVYGALQGMFNAKPDLAITIDNLLIVFEAKFTEPFDELQLTRTRNIAEVWATLLFEEFGFTQQPLYAVFKLGAKKYNPDVSWMDVLEIAQRIYRDGDRSLAAFRAGVGILGES